MARKPRVQQPGMIHHVIARGNNKESVFKKETDKIRYLQLLIKYKEQQKFKLLAYCIMDNHIHLLIKQGRVSLSKTMQCIQQSYTQYYNHKYNTIGHVFHQRFKSKPVSDESYLLALIAYIHNNPKDLGVVDLLKYKWSSHNEILKPSSKNIADVEELFALIGRKRKDTIPEYLWLLGEVDDEFVKQQYLSGDKLEEKRSEIYIEERTEIIEKRKFSILEIQDLVNDFINKTEGIVSKANERRVIVLLCDEFCDVLDKEIAEKLEISVGRVRNIRQESVNGKLNYLVLDMLEKIKKSIEENIHISE